MSNKSGSGEKKARAPRAKSEQKTVKVPVRSASAAKVKKEKAEKKAPVYMMPTYDGHKKVVRILDGGHTKTHFHCEVKDGKTLVTEHVLKSLFTLKA